MLTTTMPALTRWPMTATQTTTTTTTAPTTTMARSASIFAIVWHAIGIAITNHIAPASTFYMNFIKSWLLTVLYTKGGSSSANSRSSANCRTTATNNKISTNRANSRSSSEHLAGTAMGKPFGITNHSLLCIILMALVLCPGLINGKHKKKTFYFFLYTTQNKIIYI